MADSSTERVRRYRRHKAGDHSLCFPGRCSALGAETLPETPQEGRKAPLREVLGFESGGSALWDAVHGHGRPGPLQMPLLVEACRIVDRLDKLDRQLHGEDWLRFRHDPEDEHEVVVYIDRVLAEAREQATALKGIVAELTRTTAQQKAPVAPKGGGVLADLAARRAARSPLSAS